MRRVAGLSAVVVGALGWDSSCLSECRPTRDESYPLGRSVGSRYVCPSAARAVGPSGTEAYVVSIGGGRCPGQCRPIREKGECENAASWLRLGMDGSEGPCPSPAELVGPDGLWTAKAITHLDGPIYQQRLGGCSWRAMDTQKLWFNGGDFTQADPMGSIGAEASAVGDWLVCACKEVKDLPTYVAVVAGNECPNVEREMAKGQKPSCGILTTERNCEEAAASVGVTDRDLQMCVGHCGEANAVTQTALNTAEVGQHRPAGCHYRYHPTIADDHLWFNPHYDAARQAYAMPPGNGANPDYLLCGCGEVAKYATYTRAHDSCEAVNEKGTSKACGVGQTCSPEGLSDYRCTCLYSKDADGAPQSALNGPADCTETVPIKYISWVDGPECPWDEHSQCLSPPTKERCEKAAAALGLSDVDKKASLPHTQAEADLSPRGCLYVASRYPSQLYWNPSGGGQRSASAGRSLICECVQYPMYVPKLAGGSCSSGSMPCRNVRSGFECGLAADAVGIPAPVEWVMGKWGNALCGVDPEAGPGSPYRSCAELNCSDPATAPVRVCRWADNMYTLVAAGGLAGCSRDESGIDRELVLFQPADESGGDSRAASPELYRICNCADEGDHATIAERLGFHSAGVGDCSQGAAVCQEGDAECVNGVRRSERYDCRGLAKVACHADSRVCKWVEAEGRCEWAEANFAGESEVPAYFSDCLEHCLLLCNCTGVSFFTAAGSSPSELGGCDFFRGAVVGATGEAVRAGKGAGSWHCWSNTPENRVTTPAPSYRCAKCEMIPGQFECRNTHGCAWSAAGSCCCDPFTSACSSSWHTSTVTKERCEATDDDGRQCRWLFHEKSGRGVCELPLEQCEDEYIRLLLTGPVPATAAEKSELCVDVLKTLMSNAVVRHVRRGCGSCNVSENDGKVQVNLSVDLGGRKSCGQATRIAARHEADLLGPRGVLVEFSDNRRVIGVHARAKCWEDCAQDPKCPKGPTAAPTPISGWTKPPSPDVDPSFPSKSPTSSPSAPNGCPVSFSVQSGNATECGCEVFSDETRPYQDREHTYCRSVPEYWYGGYHFSCPHCLQTETRVVVGCPNEWETCELFVVLYHCAGCSANGSHSVNGLLPASLLAEGWVPGSCAPHFCEQDRAHPLVAWHKQIQGGDTETLPDTATDPTMYASFVVKEGRICSRVTDRQQCSGVCRWSGAGCVTDFCPKRHSTAAPGPPNPSGDGNRTVPSPCVCAPGAPAGDCSV